MVSEKGKKKAVSRKLTIFGPIIMCDFKNRQIMQNLACTANVNRKHAYMDISNIFLYSGSQTPWNVCTNVTPNYDKQ